MSPARTRVMTCEGPCSLANLVSMSTSSQQPPAGWYPDPAGSGDERYWDGGAWSQVTRPSGGVNPPSGQPGHQPVGPGAPGQAHGQQSWGQQPHGQGQYGAGQYGGAQAGYGAPALAGWWWRVLAALIDGLVWLIPLGILQSVILTPVMGDFENWFTDAILASSAGSTEIPPIPDSIINASYTFTFIAMVLWFAYRTVLVALKGATLGQMATGLRVVRDGDSSLGLMGWGRSAGRAALAVVLAQVPVVGLVNVIMAAFTRKKQTLHDMIAKTVVVRKR